MDIQPVNKAALPQMVTEQLKDQIIRGVTKPGDKLPSESSLCDSFQVSRPVLREAIAALISKGVLERRNNGIYVKKLDAGNLFDSVNLMVSTNNIPTEHILEARLALEVENAGLAALRATDADLRQMKECIDLMTAPDTTEAGIRFHATEFHDLIAKATHNILLESFYKIILEVLRQDPRAIYVLRESASQHAEIYECIRCRDVDGVRKKMCEHINSVCGTLFSNGG